MNYLLHYDHSRKITGFTAYTFLLGLVPAFGGAIPTGQHVERGPSGNVKPQVWVPIVVVVIVLVAVAMMLWSKRSLRRGLVSMGEAAAIAAGATTHRDVASAGSAQATQEVTAEQLTGGRTSTSSQNRRPRRTRRTLSQISTASLPLYMKEPGDQELVIFRGQDPEDNPDVAVIMPAVQEDREGHSRDASQDSLYGNVPDSPQDMSLMQGDETLDSTNDRSNQHLLPPNSGNSPLRGSFETGDTTRGSEESSSSLLRAVRNAGDDPRGEAPPYFEVVDSNGNDGPRQGMGGPTAESTLEASPDPPQSATIGSRPAAETRENRNSRRLSGLRNLLNTFTNTNTRPPALSVPQEPSQSTPRHTRVDSSMSATSSLTQDSRIPYNRERVGSRASHRPSNSGSGSALQLAFRTISRQKSQNTLNSAHLNSPSMISLNSISAPLTHTLTRTEISYPASGPTAEQMRLISSRESFVRFAVPYGPDAIAFAASTSRHDLEPTPNYESHAPAPGTATVVRSSPLAPVVDSPIDAPQPSSDSSSSRSVQEASGDSTETSEDIDGNSEEPLASPIKEAPSPIVGTDPSLAPVSVPLAAEPVAQVAAAPVTSATLASSVPPPSSFKPPPAPASLVRSESRASSRMSSASFATAEESMYDSAPSDADSPDSQGSSLHPHHNTDTTIS